MMNGQQENERGRGRGGEREQEQEIIHHQGPKTNHSELELEQIQSIHIRNLSINHHHLIQNLSNQSSKLSSSDQSPRQSSSSASSSSSSVASESEFDPSSSSSSSSSRISRKSSTINLSSSHHHSFNRTRKRFIRKNLFDTFITISIPSLDPSQELIRTQIESATSNPSFPIDCNRALKNNYIPQTLSAHHHSIHKSNLIKISLYARRSYANQSNQKARKTDDPNKSSSQFQLVMIWVIDFSQLKFLGKIDSESNFLPNPTSPRGSKFFNQLYLNFQDGIYFFEPLQGSDSPDFSTDSPSIDGLLKHQNGIIDQQENHIPNTSQPQKVATGSELKDMKPFVFPDLIRYMEKKVEVEQTLEDIILLEENLKTMSNTEQGRQNCQFHLSRKFSEIEENINTLNYQQTSAEIELLKLQNQLRERRAEITRRRALNEAARRELKECVTQRIIDRREDLRGKGLPRQEACRRELNQRRSELVVELSAIYPIEPVSLENNNESLLFSIANIILPNLHPNHMPPSISTSTLSSASSLIQIFNKSVDLAEDDRIVSTALGSVSHLVQLLSTYLGIPLLYPVSFIGSRSLVSDFVSRIPGTRSFPLYFKGVDRFRFEYGLFLLNKNIEQIMHHQKVVVSDLRHTLPNLKSLFLTLESNPTTLVGENEINSSTIELVNPQKPLAPGLSSPASTIESGPGIRSRRSSSSALSETDEEQTSPNLLSFNHPHSRNSSRSEKTVKNQIC